MKRKADKAGLFRPPKKNLLEAAENAVKEVNKTFSQEHHVKFNTAFQLLNNKEKKERKETIERKVKSDIESQWKETSVTR